jgi:hypothetical protein
MTVPDDEHLVQRRVLSFGVESLQRRGQRVA